MAIKLKIPAARRGGASARGRGKAVCSLVSRCAFRLVRIPLRFARGARRFCLLVCKVRRIIEQRFRSPAFAAPRNFRRPASSQSRLQIDCRRDRRVVASRRLFGKRERISARQLSSPWRFDRDHARPRVVSQPGTGHHYRRRRSRLGHQQSFRRRTGGLRA